MATNLSVRLDDETRQRLNDLVDHYNKSPGPLNGIKPSNVVRYAIERLYEAELGKKARK
jgi:hypothetical protein